MPVSEPGHAMQVIMLNESLLGRIDREARSTQASAVTIIMEAAKALPEEPSTPHCRAGRFKPSQSLRLH